eukprot:2783828-Pyramimonas_sp.AAC.1
MAPPAPAAEAPPPPPPPQGPFLGQATPPFYHAWAPPSFLPMAPCHTVAPEVPNPPFVPMPEPSGWLCQRE